MIPRRRPINACSRCTRRTQASASATLAIIFLALLSTLTADVLSSASDVNDVTSSSSPLSVEECRRLGFDPSDLPCDTCRDLLSQSDHAPTLVDQFRSECERCCSSHLVNPHIRPPQAVSARHKFVALTYDPDALSRHQEIKDFLERDVEDVIALKSDRRFKAVERKQSDGDDLLSHFFGGGGLGRGGPPTLYFYSKGMPKGWTGKSGDDLPIEDADEIVELSGSWKREDVRDMIMTLLPSA